MVSVMRGSEHRVDVAVVGGGLAGASLACALGGLGLSVAVIERRSGQPAAPAAYDARTTALTYSSRRALEGIGVWDALAAAVAPVREVHVSDAGHPGRLRIDARELDLPTLGYVVENHVLAGTLYRRLAELRDVALISGAAVTSLVSDHEAAVLTLEGDAAPSRLRCRLVVGADGASSPTRDQAGIAARRHAYDQKAVVATVSPERSLADRSWERFTREGPAALLPVDEERAALIWTVSSATAERLMSLDDADFAQQAAARFAGRVGRLQKVGRRDAYDLELVRAHQLTSERMALVGNAAHALHPVAAQGFNLGLRDVAVLAELVAAGRDPGEPRLLREYARRRRSDIARTTALTHGLVSLFASDDPLVGIGRSAGMLGVDLSRRGKRSLARRFLGLSPDMPRLMRGRPLHAAPRDGGWG